MDLKYKIMNKLIVLSFVVLLSSFKAFCQNSNYVFVEGKVKSPSSVTVILKTFAPKKKDVEKEAKCAALKIIMFDGVEGTIYNRPLLSQGIAALHDNEYYFDTLFNSNLADYIKYTKMLSNFKKAEKNEKSTLYSVEVNYIQLKKDLEKNKISKQLGL